MAFNKTRKCKWYNDRGWPRINPKAKNKDSLGCLFGDRCHYLHPDEPGWADGHRAMGPFASEYPDNVRPITPTPSPRTRTPERGAKVKAEYASPRLSLEDNKGINRRDERSPSHSDIRSPSPSGSRDMRRGRSPLHRRPFRKVPFVRSSRSRSSERRYQDSRRGRDWERGEYGDRGRGGRFNSRERERRDHGVTDSVRERNRDVLNHSFSRSDQGGTRNINESNNRDDSISTRPTIDARDPAMNVARRTTPTGPSYAGRKALQNAPELPKGEALSVQSSFELGPAPRPPNPTQSNAAEEPPGMLFNARPTSAVSVLQPPDSGATTTSFASTAQPPPDSATTQTSFASEMPQPPPPPPTSTAPPLPPLPQSSNGESSQDTKEKMSFQERIRVWDHRIELLMQATTARQKQKALSAEVQKLKYYTTGNGFAGLAPAARQSILASLKNAETGCETAKKVADAAMDKINRAEFWPVRVRPDYAEGDNEVAEKSMIKLEEEHELMKTELSDMDTTLRRMETTVREVLTFVTHRDRSFSEAPTHKHAAFARQPLEDMDTREAARAPKRRRIDDEDEKNDPTRTAGSSTLNTELQGERVSTPPLPTDAIEVQKILRRLNDLETQVSEFDNISTQTDDALQAFVDDRVDTRIEEVRQCIRKTQAEAIAVLREDVDKMGEEIGEIGIEMGKLITAQADVTEQVETQKQEGERVWSELNKIKTSLEQERARGDELRDQLRDYIEETRTLKLLVQTSKRDPPPPYSFTVDDIVESVKPSLTDAMREYMLPLLTEWRRSISASIKDDPTSKEQLDLMRGKVEKIKRMPGVLHALERMNQQK